MILQPEAKKVVGSVDDVCIVIATARAVMGVMDVGSCFYYPVSTISLDQHIVYFIHYIFIEFLR